MVLSALACVANARVKSTAEKKVTIFIVFRLMRTVEDSINGAASKTGAGPLGRSANDCQIVSSAQ